MDEYRRSERRPATLSVDLAEYRGGKQYKLKARDISPRGVFLVTKKAKAFALGQVVTLHLGLTGRKEPVVATGEVVRIVPKDVARREGSDPGIAVEFAVPQPDLI